MQESAKCKTYLLQTALKFMVCSTKTKKLVQTNLFQTYTLISGCFFSITWMFQDFFAYSHYTCTEKDVLVHTYQRMCISSSTFKTPKQLCTDHHFIAQCNAAWWHNFLSLTLLSRSLNSVRVD